MPLIAYIIAIVVAIGGLGIELELLINSPPANSSAHTAVAHATTASHAVKARPASVRQPQPAETSATLSPIYPTNPGGGLPAAESSEGASAATPVQATEPLATEGRATEARATEARATEARATRTSEAASQAKEEPLQAADRTASNQCDVRACASTYSSFRASDCTYQPYGGSRRLCSKGTRTSEATAALETTAAPEATAEPEATAVMVVPEATVAPEARGAPEARRSLDAQAEAQCNVARCSAMYQSFRASDCSYQPLNGGARALCER